MKKQILYFTLLLQVTNITLSLDPLSIGLFAGAVSWFAARQKALEENKKTTVYKYDPKIKYEGMQIIINKELAVAGKPFFDQNSYATPEANKLAEKLFINNDKFLKDLKNSITGLNYYENNATSSEKKCHQTSSLMKALWWQDKLREITLNPGKLNVTTDNTKKAAAESVLNNIKKQLNHDKEKLDFDKANIDDTGKSYMTKEDLKKFKIIYATESRKDRHTWFKESIRQFSKTTSYDLQEKQYFEIAVLDKTNQVPLTTIHPYYIQFPLATPLLRTPESFSDETTAYSSTQSLFK
ncbi:MAG: hypothetical protein ACXWL5_02245 [Candidatus Chromulinivorax sp.]